MLVFGAFERIDNMLEVVKKPVVVHAIQVDEDFRVDTLEGNYKQGKAGDYLIKGIDGENYICDRSIFERTYQVKLNGVLHDFT
jgi:hypothetical protein